MPDPTITPGAVRTVDVGEICSHGTRQLRHWDRARDDFIMREYDLPPGPHPDYEVDHLIPLGIGGADDDKNLWPEPRRSIEPVWNAETKDRLESRLRALVCDGNLDVREAQRAVAEDWTAAYLEVRWRAARMRPYPKALPSAKYLRECFDYDPKMGVLTWKARPREHFKRASDWHSWNTRCARREAGTIAADTTCRVGIDGVKYLIAPYRCKNYDGRRAARTDRSQRPKQGK